MKRLLTTALVGALGCLPLLLPSPVQETSTPAPPDTPVVVSLTDLTDTEAPDDDAALELMGEQQAELLELARTKLEESAGRVLTDEGRSALRSAIDAVAIAETPDQLASVAHLVPRAMEAVNDDVADWQADQRRAQQEEEARQQEATKPETSQQQQQDEPRPTQPQAKPDKPKPAPEPQPTPSPQPKPKTAKQIVDEIAADWDMTVVYTGKSGCWSSYKPTGVRGCVNSGDPGTMYITENVVNWQHSDTSPARYVALHEAMHGVQFKTCKVSDFPGATTDDKLAFIERTADAMVVQVGGELGSGAYGYSDRHAEVAKSVLAGTCSF